jgi:hypothetical protein
MGNPIESGSTVHVFTRGKSRRSWVLGLVGGAAVIVLSLLSERLRGAWALDQRLNELQKSGERLTLVDRIPTSVRPHSNALHSVLALSNRIGSTVSNLGVLPPAGRWTSNGTVIAAVKLADWKSGKETNSWDRIDGILESGAGVIRDLQLALQLPGWDEGFDYTLGFADFQLPRLIDSKRAAQLLQLAALSDIRGGHGALALERQKSLLRLVQMQGDSRLIITHLVRIATGHYAWDVTWEGLHAGVWNADQLAELQSAWTGFDFQSGMIRSFEMERSMTLDLFRQASSDPKVLLRKIDERFEAAEKVDWEANLPAGRFVEHWFHAPLWRFAWRHQDELRALNRWQRVVEAARAVDGSSWKRSTDVLNQIIESDDAWFPLMVPGEESRLGRYDRWRFLLSGGPFSITRAAVLKAPQADMMRRMTITAIALARFRSAESRYPDQLSDLVPAYLPVIPVDSADGHPLRYRREGTGFALYSVGENLEDDGGSSIPSKPGTSGSSMWGGLDAVWPKAASAAEIGAN